VVDDGARLAGEWAREHPVADGGEVITALRLVEHATGEDGVEGAARTPECVGAALLLGDAHGSEGFVIQLFGLILKEWAPAQVFE
jgi:hypothetical protein